MDIKVEESREAAARSPRKYYLDRVVTVMSQLHASKNLEISSRARLEVGYPILLPVCTRSEAAQYPRTQPLRMTPFKGTLKEFLHSRAAQTSGMR